jgi:ABC-type multidrug transport system fused ATPase/permease subunit
MVDRVLADYRGTALVVTHRRELIERADLVWCLHEGRVVETGPPQALLCGDGPASHLFPSTVRHPAVKVRESAPG